MQVKGNTFVSVIVCWHNRAWLGTLDSIVQAWSDKINNLFLLTVSSTDTIAPTAGSFATALSGGQNAAITAVVPYPSAPSSYFVQVSCSLWPSLRNKGFSIM